MRKVVVLTGLLVVAALFSTAPVKAETLVGCVCGTANAAPVCTLTPQQCFSQHGGVCVLPCAYEVPKKVAKRHHHKKKAK